MSIHIYYTTRQKTRMDWFLRRVREFMDISKFLLVFILYSPIFIYQWVRNKFQPEYSTIADIDDRVESITGFTSTWYNSACIDTPVSLIEQYVDVSTIIRLNHDDANKFFVNFHVVKIKSVPENVSLNSMFFTRRSFKYNSGVILQRINPDNEQWELVYYDLTTNEEKSAKSFNTYFHLEGLSNNKNGTLSLKGSNEKQKIKIKISTANTA